MVENLFIHLDDPDPMFQEKVYNVLRAALDVDQDVVIKNAKASLTSHQSPKYCNMILQYASERALSLKISGA